MTESTRTMRSASPSSSSSLGNGYENSIITQPQHDGHSGPRVAKGLLSLSVSLSTRRRRHIKHVARLIVHAVVHYDAHTPCCTCVNKRDGCAGETTETLSAAATAFLVIIFNSSINFCTHIKKDTRCARGSREGERG